MTVFVSCAAVDKILTDIVRRAAQSLCNALPSNKQHQSYDDCVEVRRENNHNCSVLCCV